MRRINILLATFITSAFFACTNSNKPLLERKVLHKMDSIISNARSKPSLKDLAITRSLEYIETVFSDDSLCIINYSFELNGSPHMAEYVFAYPIRRRGTVGKIYWFAHMIDSVMDDDRFKGIPLPQLFNLNTEETRRMVRDSEDYREFY